MSRAARSTVLAPAPVLLGEEALTPEQLVEAEAQEAARSILSRRAHRATHAVDVLRELADTATDGQERRIYWQALAAARRGRDRILALFNAARPS